MSLQSLGEVTEERGGRPRLQLWVIDTLARSVEAVDSSAGVVLTITDGPPRVEAATPG